MPAAASENGNLGGHKFIFASEFLEPKIPKVPKIMRSLYLRHFFLILNPCVIRQCPHLDLNSPRVSFTVLRYLCVPEIYSPFDSKKEIKREQDARRGIREK